MRIRNSDAKTAFLVAASTAALVSACAMMAPTMESAKIPPQGSSWSYASTPSGSFGKENRKTTTTMGMGSWQGKSMMAQHGQPTSIFVNADGCWVGMAAGSKPLFGFDPPICYRFPIAVGNSWSDKRRMTMYQAKKTVNLESHWKVEAYEEVSVPAGTFGAFRITYSDDNGTDRVDWFSPELGIWVKSSIKRRAGHPAGPGTLENILISHTIPR